MNFQGSLHNSLWIGEQPLAFKTYFAQQISFVGTSGNGLFRGYIPGYRLEEGGARCRSRSRHCGFDSRSGLGVDSASDRHECYWYLLGGKGGRCVRLKKLATFMCRMSRVSSFLCFTVWRKYVVSVLRTKFRTQDKQNTLQQYLRWYPEIISVLYRLICQWLNTPVA